MGDRQQGQADAETLEAQLRVLRAIELAQSRWREVAEAIEAGAPLPLDELTPDQERAVLNLQLRRLSPQDRERVRAHIAAVEAVLRRLRAGAPGNDPGADGSTRAGAPRGTPAAAPSGVPAPRSVRRPGPHAVRLMNDYSVDWPLWPVSSGVAGTVKELLDDELSARLRRWAQVFNAHYDHVDGWDDPALAAEHRAEADRLLAALRAALPPPWTVTLDYWETNGADR